MPDRNETLPTRRPIKWFRYVALQFNFDNGKAIGTTNTMRAVKIRANNVVKGLVCR